MPRTHGVPTGVCVLRIEPRSDGCLITARFRDRVQHSARERVVLLDDPDDALALVREFLYTFLAAVHEE